MASIESLREQAEQFVCWHRDREWTVAQVIRSLLPRYAHFSDGQVFQAEFGIADARELVALREGFKDWDALVAASRGESGPGEESAPGEDAARGPLRVVVARPFVFVRDVHAACAYYVDKLGFTLAFDYGKPAFYAEIERDGVHVCVRHTDEALVDAPRAQREDVVLASFEVTDARALYLELQERGAIFSQPLRTEPYGVRAFIVDDPEGNRLLFFDRVRQPGPA